MPYAITKATRLTRRSDDLCYHRGMHLIIEHKVRRPYAHTVASSSPVEAINVVSMWMEYLAGDVGYDDTTFVITPEKADARSAGQELAIGNLELMRIDEIRSILIMPSE